MTTPDPTPLCSHADHGRWSSLTRDLGQDIDAQVAHDAYRQANRRGRTLEVISALLTPHVMPLVFYRLSHLLHIKGWRRLARLLWCCNAVLHKTSISPASCIGGGLYLPHPVGIRFHGRGGRRLTLYSNVVCSTLDDGSHDSLEVSPRLGDDVVLGVNAAVLGPVSIGHRSRVAFNTCLHTSVPDDATAISRAVRVVIRPGPASP